MTGALRYEWVRISTVEANRVISGLGEPITLTCATWPSEGGDPQGLLLPGLPNLHSHAFQRGMAGLTEIGGGDGDSFWSWRELMYRFLAHLRPDAVQAIAAQAYMEMLESGFTRVGEFHYLHHDADGRPYADRAEMSVQIAAAAELARGCAGTASSDCRYGYRAQPRTRTMALYCRRCCALCGART